MGLRLSQDLTISTSGGFVLSDAPDGEYTDEIILSQSFSGPVYIKFSASNIGYYNSTVFVTSGDLQRTFEVIAEVIDESFSIFVDELERKYIDENGNGYVINNEVFPYTSDWYFGLDNGDPQIIKYFYPSGENYFLPLVTDVIVPPEIFSNNIDRIGQAFSGSPIISVDISNTNITQILPGAFYNCLKLIDVIFSETLTKIDVNAFGYCPLLSISSLPDNVNFVGSHCFTGCESITSFTMPASLSSTERAMFGLCINLSEINLRNVQTVAYEMLLNCPVTRVIIGQSVDIYDEASMGIYKFKPYYGSNGKLGGLYIYDLDTKKWGYTPL